MPGLSPRRRLATGAVAVLCLLVAACGDDDQADTTTTSSTTSTEATTTTTEATTTTTEPPRRLSADELRGILLRPDEVPDHLELDEEDPSPGGWQGTDPPECGEMLNEGGTGEVRATTTYSDPRGYLSYGAVAEHTPGQEVDLDVFREAFAGPCATFGYETDGGDRGTFRLALIRDLEDLGDDAMLGRMDIVWEQPEYQVEQTVFTAYFRRGDVSVQVDVSSTSVPARDVFGPEITPEEAERLARRIDADLVALLEG